MSTINAVTRLDTDGEIAVVTINSPPVNALSLPVREGLAEAFKRTAADDAVKAVVVICEGRTFFAGADISEFGRPAPARDPAAVDYIEGSPKPVVAAIHGTALGGGLELAMRAHYRVSVPSARFGLPEINIGLLPGGGGTQRLPRIVGVEKALEMITTGRHAPAKEALEMGLVDEIVPEGELRQGAIAFARRLVAENRPLVKIRDNNAKLDAARGHPEIFAAFRKANARKFRGFVAPENNIKAVEAAVTSASFDEGIAEERRLFAELLAGRQSAAQRYYFFAERQAQKVPDVPDDTPLIPIKKVGIIGAGTMGGGIAMNFANIGVPAVIVEQKQEALDRGLATIRKNYERTASRGGITAQQVEDRMALITGSLSMEDSFGDVDLVIEAVFERMDIKKDIFAKLDAICKPGAILASNTSGLNIDEIASVTQRPQDVIGLHFFSPANVMKLLEIVRGEKTSETVIATSMKLAKQIGKVAILVGVCPGFVVNRINGKRGRETQKLLLEGAMPWDVDRALYNFGYAMGPFQVNDLAGLDIGWVKEKSTSSNIREVLCEMDRRGQKTGAGYYDYDENRNPQPSPVTEEIIQSFRAKTGANGRTLSDEEIIERCVYPLINEGLKVIEEGIVNRASDIDVGFVNGSGWPVYRGGPMFYGDEVGGPATILAKMREYEATMGEDYKPAALLEKLVAEGKSFADL